MSSMKLTCYLITQLNTLIVQSYILIMQECFLQILGSLPAHSQHICEVGSSHTFPIQICGLRLNLLTFSTSTFSLTLTWDIAYFPGCKQNACAATVHDVSPLEKWRSEDRSCLFYDWRFQGWQNDLWSGLWKSVSSLKQLKWREWNAIFFSVLQLTIHLANWLWTQWRSAIPYRSWG